MSDELAEVKRQRDVLAQAIWDARAALGFDNDGDPGPSASIAGMGYDWFASAHVKEAREQVADYDDLLDKWCGKEPCPLRSAS